ncbi:hypothetical protein KJ839_02795, partial [Patescibacteria group bacterium]|nr:hypothetical protein [Patescibacteria group bacterium]
MSERKQEVRRALQDKEVSLRGITKIDHQEVMETFSQPMEYQVGQLLKALGDWARDMGHEPVPEKEVEKWMQGLGVSFRKFIKVHERLAAKKKDLSFDDLDIEEQKEFLESVLHDFQETYGYLKHAGAAEKATSYNEPNLWLEIITDPNISEDYKLAGILRRAAISNPTDPKAFIQNAEKAVKTLQTDSEISDEYKLPWILRRAAISNPTDPKAFIQNAEKAVNTMKEDPEIAEDYKLPWILRHAAIHNPTD